MKSLIRFISMKNENKSKECFVAFIDVLGFKELIDLDAGSGNKLKEVKQAIDAGLANLKEKQNESNGQYSFWFDEFKVKSFSDCFCFSVPLEFDKGMKDYEQNFVAFYAWIHVFYNELLNMGFLCRGGITQGWHYVDDDVIFSEALVEAYLIESRMTNFPIIRISDKLIKKIKSSRIPSEEYYPFQFANDNAGRNFLHPFNYSIVDEMFFAGKSKADLSTDIAYRDMLMKQYLEIIDTKIVEHHGKDFVDKFQWLKEFVLFTTEGHYADKFASGLK